MANIVYVLRTAYVGTNPGGVFRVDDSRSLNLATELANGGGQIAADETDNALIAALDSQPALKRNGTTTGAPTIGTARAVAAYVKGGRVVDSAGATLLVRQALLDGLRPDVRSMAEKLAAGTVLTAPPAFTLGNGVTTIAGSTLIDHNDARFLYTSGPTVVVSNYRAARPAATVAETAQVASGSYPLRVEWSDDAASFEIRTRPRPTSKWRLWIDGVPNVISPAVFTTTDDTDRLLLVANGSNVMRHYVLEMSGEGFFGGIRHLPADNLMKPPRRTGPRALIVADSYGLGASGTGNDAVLGYAAIAMRMLGIEDFWQSASAGGTGFLANATNTGATYDQRFAPDIAGAMPANEALLNYVQASINDTSQGTPAQVATGANAYMRRAMSAFPEAFHVLASPMFGADPASFSSSLAPYSAALADVAAGLGIPYIDACGAVPGSKPWFVGTRYRNADGTHLTVAGQPYLGRLTYAALMRALNGEMVIW